MMARAFTSEIGAEEITRIVVQQGMAGMNASGGALLFVDGGPSSTKTTGHLRMNGREVFRHAVQKISGVIEETLVERIAADAGLPPLAAIIAQPQVRTLLEGVLGCSPYLTALILRHPHWLAAGLSTAAKASIDKRRTASAVSGGMTAGMITFELLSRYFAS